MGDSLITIIAIFLAAILMFVFPLAAISEMNDSETLALVQSYTTEFVNKIISKGRITKEDYNEYIQKLYATGNSYEVEIEVQIADTNPGKKTDNDKIGDIEYYGIYDPQIMPYLESDKGYFALNEGDLVKVITYNTNKTISQMIKTVLYNVTGDESYISTQVSGTSTVTSY